MIELKYMNYSRVHMHKCAHTHTYIHTCIHTYMNLKFICIYMPSNVYKYEYMYMHAIQRI